jgi:hypothetical protein
MRCVILVLTAYAALAWSQEPKNLVVNPGFEDAQGGWGATAWSRDEGAIRASFDETVKHGGKASLHIVHTGDQDWSWSQTQPLPVKPGDILETSAWFKVQRGPGHIEASVILRDAKNEVLDWSYGTAAEAGLTDWKQVTRRFVIPDDGATILFRVIGAGPIEAWVDDCRLVKKATVEELRGGQSPTPASIANPRLELSVAAGGEFSVRDRRSGYLWHAAPVSTAPLALAIRKAEGSIKVEALDVLTDQRPTIAWRFVGQ